METFRHIRLLSLGYPYSGNHAPAIAFTMGFVLSIIYFVTYYLTPAYLFGSLADAHVQVIIAILIAIVSLPALMKSFILRNPQTLALIGLALAVTLSAVIGRHYLT